MVECRNELEAWTDGSAVMLYCKTHGFVADVATVEQAVEQWEKHRNAHDPVAGPAYQEWLRTVSSG